MSNKNEKINMGKGDLAAQELGDNTHMDMTSLSSFFSPDLAEAYSQTTLSRHRLPGPVNPEQVR